jgi:RNA polymerase sigma-70 factor, ECF subfamily
MSSKAACFPNALARAPEVREGSVETKPNAQSKAPEMVAGEAPVPDATDELLLGRVREGGKEALGILFRRHARTVRNVAYRILRDEAEADDLVQEVFLFLFRKAGLFDPNRGSAVSWLVQVAYHRAFDRRRYLSARGFYACCELDEAVLQREEPQAATLSYEDTIEAALGQDVLSRIEASLSDVQRRVLHLRFFEGHTMEEIAAILGQSAGNVRNHYYRALEKMRGEVFAAKLKGK